MIKVVLCDMDGTLVPFGTNDISARTLEAIKKLRAAGIHFGPATGREAVDLLGYFRGDESCFATGIMANGKVVAVDGTFVEVTRFDADVVERLAQMALADPMGALLFYEPLADGAPGDLVAYGITQEELDRYSANFDFPIASRAVSELPTVQPTSLDYYNCGDFANDDAVRQRLAEVVPELVAVRPAPGVFDLLPRGVDKAAKLPVIKEALGVEDDEIAFFGDSENDLVMFDALPVTFAMGNATDDAKARARYVIDDAANDGVAQVLEVLAANGGDLAAVEKFLGLA